MRIATILAEEIVDKLEHSGANFDQQLSAIKIAQQLLNVGSNESLENDPNAKIWKMSSS